MNLISVADLRNSEKMVDIYPHIHCTYRINTHLQMNYGTFTVSTVQMTGFKYWVPKLLFLCTGGMCCYRDLITTIPGFLGVQKLG